MFLESYVDQRCPNWSYTLEYPVEFSKISIFDSYPRPTKSLASGALASIFLKNLQVVTGVHYNVTTVKLIRDLHTWVILF